MGRGFSAWSFNGYPGPRGPKQVCESGGTGMQSVKGKKRSSMKHAFFFTNY